MPGLQVVLGQHESGGIVRDGLLGDGDARNFDAVRNLRKKL